MRIEYAVESLLEGEIADFVTYKPKFYGSTLCVTVFRRRLIVDFIKPATFKGSV